MRCLQWNKHWPFEVPPVLATRHREKPGAVYKYGAWYGGERPTLHPVRWLLQASSSVSSRRHNADSQRGSPSCHGGPSAPDMETMSSFPTQRRDCKVSLHGLNIFQTCQLIEHVSWSTQQLKISMCSTRKILTASQLQRHSHHLVFASMAGLRCWHRGDCHDSVLHTSFIEEGTRCHTPSNHHST